MTDGIDAERRIQHQKDPPGTGQHKATHTAYPAVVGVAYEKRQRHPGQKKGNIPAVLPHHYRVFPQPGAYRSVLCGLFLKNQTQWLYQNPFIAL
jgi:hypothetical protein